MQPLNLRHPSVYVAEGSRFTLCYTHGAAAERYSATENLVSQPLTVDTLQ